MSQQDHLLHHKGFSRRSFLSLCAQLSAGVALASQDFSNSAYGATTQPNIVFILADDLGFQNITSYGGQSYSTSNIDALAQSGVRFKYCFASALCTPSRAELLTGRYAFRTKVRGLVSEQVTGSSCNNCLDPSKEITIANILKQAGYDTAHCGKWHLWPSSGFNGVDYAANIAACGFDQTYFYYGSTIDYGTPSNYLPRKQQDWVNTYLTSRPNSSKPFFLYYAFGLPHSPFSPTPLNPTGTANSIQNYPYMIQYMDLMVGETVQKLKDLGLDQNTIIIFSGDNGTDSKISSLWNGSTIKGGKSSLKDTGIWVPLITYWPGVTPANTVCEALIDFSDFMPTLAEIGGGSVPSDRRIDGRSFVPQLQNPTTSGRDYIYSQLNNNCVVRNQNYKISGPVGTNPPATLVDLRNSPISETTITNPTSEQLNQKTLLQGYYGQIMS